MCIRVNEPVRDDVKLSRGEGAVGGEMGGLKAMMWCVDSRFVS